MIAPSRSAALDLGLYERVVSDDVLGEVERNLIAGFPHLDPARLGRRVDQMRRALEANVLIGPADTVPDVVNEKDRHVIAAAGEAAIVVTNDRRLRSEGARMAGTATTGQSRRERADVTVRAAVVASVIANGRSLGTGAEHVDPTWGLSTATASAPRGSA